MLFIQTLWTNPVYFFTVCLIVTFSVCLHEYFHAWMGVREGDYTLQDHLTLNPVKQMGFMSLLMMAFFGIAWGGVPVNPTLLRGRWSMLKVSVAGPVANFVLFLAGGILLGISYRVPGLEEQARTMLQQFLALLRHLQLCSSLFQPDSRAGAGRLAYSGEHFPEIEQRILGSHQGIHAVYHAYRFSGSQFSFCDRFSAGIPDCTSDRRRRIRCRRRRKYGA